MPQCPRDDALSTRSLSGEGIFYPGPRRCTEEAARSFAAQTDAVNYFEKSLDNPPRLA